MKPFIKSDSGEIYEFEATRHLLTVYAEKQPLIAESKNVYAAVKVYEDIIFEALKYKYEMKRAEFDLILDSLCTKQGMQRYIKTILALFNALFGEDEKTDGDSDDFLSMYEKTPRGKKLAEMEQTAKERLMEAQETPN